MPYLCFLLSRRKPVTEAEGMHFTPNCVCRDVKISFLDNGSLLCKCGALARLVWTYGRSLAYINPGPTVLQWETYLGVTEERR